MHEQPEASDPGEAFRRYQMLGTFSTALRHQGDQDYMLRRADWRRRHGVNKMSVEELLARSVTDAQRAAEMRAPEGMTTLGADFRARLDAEHDRREATRWRPAAALVAVSAPDVNQAVANDVTMSLAA